MLARAGQRVDVVRGTGESLPFATGAFDAAYLISVLEFARDPVALLREARRVTRSRVVVLSCTRNSALGLRRRLAALLGNRIFRSASFYSRGELVESLQIQGISVHPQVRDTIFHNHNRLGDTRDLCQSRSQMACLGAVHRPDVNHMAGAIKNILEDLAGVICDGAKAGCALKLNTAAGAAVQAALFSLQGINVQDTDGIVGNTPENTIKNMGTLSHEGMVETDKTILQIMIEKEKKRQR